MDGKTLCSIPIQTILIGRVIQAPRHLETLGLTPDMDTPVRQSIQKCVWGRGGGGGGGGLGRFCKGDGSNSELF